MERYEAYKDSGVEWIGEIPAGWDIRPSKWFIRITNGSDPSTPGNTPVYGSSGVSFKTCGEFKLPPAVLLGRKGTIDSPSYIDHRYWNVDTAFDATSRENGLTLRYYFYLSTCFDYPKYQTNTAVPSMTQSDYRDMQLPIPDLIEQRAITDFLDAKTTEIDGIVVDYEREVEVLQEYRKAVISEAVTKGLDPSAPMKDSGIEWIGEIPEGWGTSKIKYSFVNRDAARIPIEASKRDQNADVLYPYYGASGIVDYISDFIFNEDLLLIGEDGANLRFRNLPLIYAATGKYWVNNHAHILKPREDVIFKFAFYQLELIDLENYLTGSTQPKLTAENLGRIPLALPPLSEQRAIVEYLDAKTAQIDSLIDARRQTVEKLREYRKSLISEAVTGKFKVPGVN